MKKLYQEIKELNLKNEEEIEKMDKETMMTKEEAEKLEPNEIENLPSVSKRGQARKSS